MSICYIVSFIKIINFKFNSKHQQQHYPSASKEVPALAG